MAIASHVDVVGAHLEYALPRDYSSLMDCEKHVFVAATVAALHAKFGERPEFRAWFAYIHDTGRMRLIPAGEVAQFHFPACVDQEYLIAGFFAAQRHLRAHVLPAAAVAEFRRFGVQVHDISSPLRIPFGSGPIKDIVLSPTTAYSPDVVAECFLGERSVVVYDKYINRDSMDVLGRFVRCLCKGATVTILTTDMSIAAAIEGRRRIAGENPDLGEFRVKKVDRRTASNSHERHVVVGRRYHLHFTSGLDVFGTCSSGRYQNRDGRIYVHDVWDQYCNAKLNDEDGRTWTLRVGQGTMI